MRRKVPSTTVLMGFEAAARHVSFTEAAQELSLTQSAICRQIASLEEFLGVKLFRRGRQGVRLTDAGYNYHRLVAQRLNEIERDTLSVMGNHGTENALELAVVPTFGTRWLIPRLRRFKTLYPNITVNMTNKTRPFLFSDTPFDAAIYFGDGNWSGTRTTLFMHERPVPVCSPDLIAPKKALAYDEILSYPLLQQTTRPYAWREWFRSLDMRVERDMSGQRYELFTMLAEAASHGMGIALIPPFLIERELASGQLVVPVSHSFQSRGGYYFALPDHRKDDEIVNLFREWVLSEGELENLA
ncbi:LysR substrate-binding domain-containing protein [Marinobacter bohaiensis]|uniref:LysR substrate-binding domain-containing protein n=1 Tax=Marinobacter bohaiensis TaxID=2201898 RepID=UPI000DAE1398|nr:LysR substrate-binding domain-containing protein [Marinobacter bohaiensis]